MAPSPSVPPLSPPAPPDEHAVSHEHALRREHARQKQLQRHLFEAQMAQLERQQAEEQRALRSSRTHTPLEPLFDDLDDGLHGSNVPGLRSLSALSAHATPTPADDPPPPPSITKRPARIDLVYELDRLHLSPSSPRQSAPGTPGTRPLPQDFRPDDRAVSPASFRPPSARSNIGSPPAMFPPLANASPGPDLTSLLEDDDAFVNKYHLHVPPLGRRSPLSASSAALDLAPLQMGHAWPQMGKDLTPASPGTPLRGSHSTAGRLSPASGTGTPTHAAHSHFDGFSGLFASPTFPSFDAPAAPAHGRASADGVRCSTYFDAFSSRSPLPLALLGQETTNTLPPASSSAAAAAAAAAAGLKHPRKGELDLNTRLEDLQGEILGLCKDQHGCRYLQKKLEGGDAVERQMIFVEIQGHFPELMTDPFGNYLCQKMVQYGTDEQRDLLVDAVAGDLVRISLNMHGTRAVQTMIDSLSSARQVHRIIVALSLSVVELIKDLNGNHVIQKCLQRLGGEDNQFIYNAVAAHTVEVATHRHGCCVLQRCIDHASDTQRTQLVQEITYDALTLVQDPFGNYVVQYVLDLGDSGTTESLISQFVGHVSGLSVQKFSSNVMEKCIRVADAGMRHTLISELLDRLALEKLLRDGYANYVVQTALDYAEPAQRQQLVHAIRPILPMIRNTPYGKRIQSKLQREGDRMVGYMSYPPMMVPRDGYIPPPPPPPPPYPPAHALGGTMGGMMYQPPPMGVGVGMSPVPGVGVPGVPGVSGVPGVPPQRMGMPQAPPLMYPPPYGYGEVPYYRYGGY